MKIHMIMKFMMKTFLLIVLLFSVGSTGERHQRSGFSDSAIVILRKAVLMNENFKKKAYKSNDSMFRANRLELEIYCENALSQILRRIEEDIYQNENHVLAAQYLKLAISFENSADEEIPIVLAEIFYRSPEIIEREFKRLSVKNRNSAVKSLSWGWENLVSTKDKEDKRIKKLSGRVKKIGVVN
jgi:hypothetical protein